MPLSTGKITSRNIIAYIKSRKDTFTIGHLAGNMNSVSGGKSKTVRKKKNKLKKQHKEMEKIMSLLYALTSAGFLRKKNKSYVKVSSFNIEGKIFINSSGNGMVRDNNNTEVHVYSEDTGKAHNRDIVEAEIFDFRRNLLYGRVIRVIEKQRELFLGKINSVKGRLVFFTLLDTPAEKIACAEVSKEESAKMEEESETRLFLIKETGGKILNVPKCKIINSYSLDEDEIDFLRISIKHGLPAKHSEYDELNNINPVISAEEISSRKDYRNLFTITIDGEDAKDFDDAISLVREGDNYRLFIHIADVSHYVSIDTPLDNEALKRGTSFYIGNRVIPMLPEILSNNLCSLVEGTDRLTMTAEILYSRQGRMLSADFHRGVINVDRRLTYRIAGDILNEVGNGPLFQQLKEMYSLAVNIKKKRLQSGRIDLNLRDIKLVFENNRFKEIITSERLMSHEIVEEFMLSANTAVAAKFKDDGRPSLYRNHEKISSENLVLLSEFLKLHNLRLDPAGNMGIEIQKILESVKNMYNEHVINLVILKSMMQAFYSGVPMGHFGLGFTDYTHFTSPIRRYPDLVVHRCLKTLIDGNPPPYTFEAVSAIGEKSSLMERVAQEAERDMVKLKSCRYMEDRIGEIFSGVVSGVAKFGIFISLNEYPVEGLIPMRLLTDDYYLVEEDKFRITSKKFNKRFTIGDSIEVRLVSVDPDMLRIDFDLSY